MNSGSCSQMSSSWKWPIGRSFCMKSRYISRQTQDRPNICDPRMKGANILSFFASSSVSRWKFCWKFWMEQLKRICHCQQQQFYSGLPSPGWSNSIYFWNDSWVQTFHINIIVIVIIICYNRIIVISGPHYFVCCLTGQ